MPAKGLDCRSNRASALQYVPELTWILFLRILDAQEQKAREEAEALGNDYSPALSAPYRWQDWAAPFVADTLSEGKPIGWKRKELFEAGDGKLFEFINNELLPHLHSLDIDLYPPHFKFRHSPLTDDLEAITQ
ncbi:MAG: type I restriction-modification system subunit M N-terminal domain-containing protein [Methylococcaceae bacterium]|nr:type I restriction-modification system subunit M N-terminal domain-containing protein [Methylococcaceae bacterium]